jgi:O-antigen ligase
VFGRAPLSAQIQAPARGTGSNGAARTSRVRIGEISAIAQASRNLLPAGLLVALLIAEIFDYKALQLFDVLKVLFTVTPDRLIFLLIIGGAVRARLSGDGRRWIGGVELWMGLFTVLCFVSYLFAQPDANLPAHKWLTTLFNLTILPFGVYVVAKQSTYDRSKTITVLRGIVCVGIYLSFTAVFEHYRDSLSVLVWPKYILDPHVGIQYGRSRGPFVGSNPMGEWLAFVYVATSLLWSIARRAEKLVLQLLIPVTVVGIYFTSTRGCWLSLAAAVVIIIARGGNRFARQSHVMVVLIAIAFVSGIGSKFAMGQETLFSKRQNTIDYRLSNFETAINMGMANPLTGVGYGQFAENWKAYFGRNQEARTKDLADGNHNTYLGLFADMGYPGVLGYIILLALLGRECLRAKRSLLDKTFERHLSTVGLIGLAIVIIEAITGDMRFNPTLNTLAFLFLGIAASVQTSVRQPPSVQPLRVGLTVDSMERRRKQ